MSPPTSVRSTVAKTENDLAEKVALSMKDSGFRFGLRKQVNGSSNPSLKVSKDSHRIRKPPSPLPQIQYRPPIIIHTYSPKVIHTQPDDFMSLVQKLTGSSDTRLRFKKTSNKENSGTRKDHKSCEPCGGVQSTDSASLERQGSGSSTTTNCGSSSVSDESAVQVSDSCEGEVGIKQSNSPRSPLDSPFEFDNSDPMFSPFDFPTTLVSSTFNSHTVKSEPMFSFPKDNSYNFYTDDTNPALVKPVSAGLPKSFARPQTQQELVNPYGNFYTNSSVPSSSYLSSSLMTTLPDLSAGTQSWSQSFLDLPSSPVHSGYFGLQAPYQRQRPLQQYAGAYSASSEGNMVALENIHTFMMT
ncbi:uncharacterized protein [Physcomitrium patens]|uniref:VQ domain-containing protein n=1 Tax=Physcomitrium patens TaxID=3218 RepID=A0A2K1KEA4_PHYPA|nr:uncharacterized protein LOC112284038 [Physcomitrium patens]PNR52111.1 hypothetical protein PHYPA_008485 [Physcomitrium patens]|eukprot:XP_024379305.1 uncharacterized protein LOC112284038 [Physcomitrella patens]